MLFLFYLLFDEFLFCKFMKKTFYKSQYIEWSFLRFSLHRVKAIFKNTFFFIEMIEKYIKTTYNND